MPNNNRHTKIRLIKNESMITNIGKNVSPIIIFSYSVKNGGPCRETCNELMILKVN